MKFTYDTKQDDRECVAVIYGGHLILKSADGCGIVLPNYTSAKEHMPFVTDEDGWNCRLADADHKFYPGDKVTIEF